MPPVLRTIEAKLDKAIVTALARAIKHADREQADRELTDRENEGIYLPNNRAPQTIVCLSLAG